MNSGRTVTGVVNRQPTTNQEDQIRDYRRLQRAAFNLRRQFHQHGRYNQTLESQLDPNTELEISQRRRANLVPAETLYSSAWSEPVHRVYQHYSEERILCTEPGQQVNMPFINDQSYEALIRARLQHIHLGLIMIRAHAIHRRNAGTNALIVLRDTRWPDDRSIIGTMEMDLSRGTQLVYIVPDFMLSVEDFRNHIELAIQTHGYEGYQGAESNLLITRALIGRLTNTSHAGFRYNIQHVADYLASNGIMAVPGTPRSTEELQGRRWILQPPQAQRNLAPQTANTTTLLDGSISLRFGNYSASRPSISIARDTADKEALHEEALDDSHEEFIGVTYADVNNCLYDRKEIHYGIRCDECFQTPIRGPRFKSTVQRDFDLCAGCLIWHRHFESFERVYLKKESTREIWDTLGQDSGKYNYLVKYTIPEEKIPFSEIKPTGWGDEDEDAIPSSPTPIYDTYESDKSQTNNNPFWKYESDTTYETYDNPFWKSGEDTKRKEARKILANIKYGKSAKRNKINTSSEILAMTREEDLEYPKIQELEETLGEKAFSSVISSYRPPPEPIMGQVNYPPARDRPQQQAETSTAFRPQTFRPKEYNHSNTWQLPSAQQNSGAILILPEDIGLYNDVISRWESITINLINEKTWLNGRQKMEYIENLLGENEQKIWVQWRMAYTTEYEALLEIADETRNLTSQIRRVITLEDPHQGSTIEQDQAYQDIERLTCDSIKDLIKFMNDYKMLAAKSGRMFINAELSEKLFRKMPPLIGREIETAFQTRYPGNTIGVMPRITFSYNYLKEQCQKAALQRSLKDLSFCSQIPIPGYYQKRRRYGLRKAKTYKGKPHDSHIRVFKRKKQLQQRKCKCFICGEEGHFARDCNRKRGNIARAAVMDQLDLPDDYDILSVDLNEPDSDAICSVSENETGFLEGSARTLIQELPWEDELILMLGSEDCGWKSQIFVGKTIKNCQHEWELNQVNPITTCLLCKIQTIEAARGYCLKCGIIICPLCALNYFHMKIKPKRTYQHLPMGNQESLIKELTGYIQYLEADKRYLLEKELQQECEDLLKEIPQSAETETETEKESTLKILRLHPDVQMIKRRTPESAGYDIFSIEEIKLPPGERRLFHSGISIQLPPKTYGRLAPNSGMTQKGIDVGREIINTDYTGELMVLLINNSNSDYQILKEQTIAQLILQRSLTPETEEIMITRKAKKGKEALESNEQFFAVTNEQAKTGKTFLNRLYNMTVIITIPGIIPTKVQAILDTGATTCAIHRTALPEEAFEKLKYDLAITGIASRQKTTMKVKTGTLQIGAHTFRLPFTFQIDMYLKDGIQMLIGCNFIKSLGGGLRIEGNEVTFYKEISTIETRPEAYCANLALTAEEEEEILRSEETLYVSQIFQEKFSPLLQQLRKAGYIGETPLKFWQKNKVRCTLDIINPDITIQDKPLRHITPAMEKTFKVHIDALLKLKVIRPSKSRHRTMAFIVNSGTIIDPETRKEKRGKERMVLNYKTLNDNTFKDQYSLPGINLITKKIGRSNIFSKFDLKSGFHQVAMEEESIPWTAFIVPQGLFEWLVMPFGLKNAPAIFQRKMDFCFQDFTEFIAVYIDDILVFSRNEQEHEKHLYKMLEVCKNNGLVLSPTKMQIGVPEIEFLGVTIGNQRIRLQEHIIKKIITFNDKEITTTKGLRTWLGILNYARAHIPKLGTLLGPLYSKTSPKGDRKFKESDWAIIRNIKAQVQQLPDLEVPPEEAHIIIETDGCMEGWGAVCKWKPKQSDPRSSERICAYASGKFPILKSTIDAEIHACMEGLSALKIHYLDKGRITLRTDCQAIISFFNKSAQNKPSRVRWLSFTDYITGTGIEVTFEHIDGRLNGLADSLSRLVQCLQTEKWTQQQHHYIPLLEEAITEVSASPSKLAEERLNRLLKLLTTTGHYPEKSIQKEELSCKIITNSKYNIESYSKNRKENFYSN